MRRILGTALLALVALLPCIAAQDRPNVLFVCVDDLRPELRCYGESHMVTPSLDGLAREGRLFLRHYVQVPTCGASRYSLLTGLRPTTNRSLNNGAFAALPRKPSQRTLTLPVLFRENGYHTASIGKVSHSPDGRLFKKNGPGGSGVPEMPFGWAEVGAPAGRWGRSWAAFFGYADGSTRKPGRSPPLESADVDDRGYPDGLIADAAIEKLEKLAARKEGAPFLLAVGFYKPHLPFNAPLRYARLYDEKTLPSPPVAQPPVGVDPKVSLHRGGELFGNYGSHPARPRRDAAYCRRLRHAYAACVSYVDAQIGRVLARLKALDLARNTIVIVWGDHGWHLGDHGVWGKHTLHERSLRSALIIRTPAMRHPGAPAPAVVESVDLMPTLADLCDLRPPDPLDGRSLRPQLDDPVAPGDGVALGDWRRGKLRGRSVRTRRWRLTTWHRGEEQVQTELYDHDEDPAESKNVAGAHPEVVKRLGAHVR